MSLRSSLKMSLLKIQKRLIVNQEQTVTNLQYWAKKIPDVKCSRDLFNY